MAAEDPALPPEDNLASAPAPASMPVRIPVPVPVHVPVPVPVPAGTPAHAADRFTDFLPCKTARFLTPALYSDLI